MDPLALVLTVLLIMILIVGMVAFVGRRAQSQPSILETRRSKSPWGEPHDNEDIFALAEMQVLLPDRRLEAIKLYRERKGVSLKEASEAIADYLDGQPHEQKG